MQAHALVAIVTLAALLVYISTIFGVGAARRKSGINAPAMTGDPGLERAIRIQSNALESLPIFLPSLWLCHLFWLPQDPTGLIVAAIGTLWIIGRILYGIAYAQDPSKRETGFIIQFIGTIVLLLGALGKAVVTLVVG